MTTLNDMQDFTHEAIPANKGPRLKWLYLTNVEAAVAVCVPVLMFGSFLGTALTPLNLLYALLISGTILSLISGWSSYVGTKTRLSTALLVKKSFGEQGAKVIWCIMAISSFGWFGIQTELFAKAFIILAEKTYPTLHFNETLITVISGLLMASTAVLGIKGVGKLAQLSMPLLLAVLAYALFMAVSQNGFSSWLSYTPEKSISLGAAIAAIIGSYSLGAIVMPDVKRFAKNTSHSISSAILALGFFYPFLLSLAAITASLTHQPNFMELLLTFGFGGLTLIVLMLATWTTNDINLYGASLSLTSILPKFKRTTITAICGIFGTIIACFGLFENMMSLFMLLGVLIMPLFAIYGVDFLKDQFKNMRKIPQINWSAFFSWITASTVGILTTPVADWGLGLFTLTTVSGLDSLLTACLVYPILFKLMNKK